MQNARGKVEPPSLDQYYWRQSHQPLLAHTYRQCTQIKERREERTLEKKI